MNHLKIMLLKKNIIQNSKEKNPKKVGIK